MRTPDSNSNIEGGEGVISDLESHLADGCWKGEFGIRGNIRAVMIIDTASGRFCDYVRAVRPESGQSALVVTWTIKNSDTWINKKSPLASITGIEVGPYEGAALLSALAQQRVNAAVDRIRERIREN